MPASVRLTPAPQRGTPLMPKMSAVQKANTPQAIRQTSAHPQQARVQAQQVRQTTLTNSNQADRLARQLFTQSATQAQSGEANFGVPHISGGSRIGPGAILAPASGFDKVIGQLSGNLASDVGNLPHSLLQGSLQLGGAAIDSIKKGQFGLIGGMPTQLEKVASQATQSDPLYNLVTGHPARALQLAEQHPLNAAMDATGVYGVAGRALGAAARAAGSDAANLARPARELAPGIPGTAVAQRYSPNLFTQMGQKASEANPTDLTAGIANKLNDAHIPGGRPLNIVGDAAKLKKQTALFYGAEKARNLRDHSSMVKAINDTKPAGKVEAAATPYVTAFGLSSPAEFAAKAAELRDAKAGLYGPIQSGVHTDAHIKLLDAAANKPNLNMPAMQADATGYAVRQAALEAQKADLGLTSHAEMARALEKQYALERIPGTDFMPKSQEVIHPDSVVERLQSRAALREATQAHTAALADAKGAFKAHTGASRVLADVAKRLPVHPVTDTLANHLIDQRIVHDQSLLEQRALSAEHLVVRISFSG